MKLSMRILYLGLLSVLCSCQTDETDGNSLTEEIPHVTGGYLTNIERLSEYGIDINYSKLGENDYVKKLVSDIIQISDNYYFESHFKINYNTEGLVSSFELEYDNLYREDESTYENASLNFNAEGNRILLNGNPIKYDGNQIRLSREDGHNFLGSSYELVIEREGKKILRHYFNHNGVVQDYSYSYLKNNFLEKEGYYKVTDYHDKSLNVPWLFQHSQIRIFCEVGFGLRLMEKIPKIVEEYAPNTNDDIEITHVIQDGQNRVILLVAKHINKDYLPDDITVYTYN